MWRGEARNAHAGECVVTGHPLSTGSVTVTGKITGYGIRNFVLGDLPPARCINTQLTVPCTYELVITTEDPPDGGEQQNPPTPPKSDWGFYVTFDFRLNGQNVSNSGNSIWLTEAGNLTYEIVLRAEFTDIAANSSGWRESSRQFPIKVIRVDGVDGPPGVCKGGTATYTVRTTPEDGAEYVTVSTGAGEATRDGNTFSIPCEEPGNFTVTFSLLDCWSTDRGLTVVEIKDVTYGGAPDPVCANSTTTLSATVNPPGVGVTWSIVGDAHGCSVERDNFTAGTEPASVTVKAQGPYGCSATGEIPVAPAGVYITTVPPYALKDSTKDVDANPIWLKAGLACYPPGGTYTWTVVEGAGQFGHITDANGEYPQGFNLAVNGTPQAKEIVFRATQPGLTKVKVTYTREGQPPVESQPVEFKSYNIVLTLQKNSNVCEVCNQDITYTTKLTGDHLGTPGDLSDDEKDWGSRPVTWHVKRNGTLVSTVTDQVSYVLNDRVPGNYEVWAEIKINPSVPSTGTSSTSRVGVDAIEINANGSWQRVDGQTIVLLKGTKYTFRAIRCCGQNCPSDKPVWSGLASGAGETIEVTFNGSGGTLTAQHWNSKSVTIEVIAPVIDSVEIDGIRITDVPFSGWKRGRTGQSEVNAPGCYKQGTSAAVWARFWHTKDLTFETPVELKADVDSDSDDELMGGDLQTSITFTGTWSTVSYLLQFPGSIPARIQKDSYVDIDFYYRVPSPNGSGQWIGADDCGWLTVYVVWDEPVEGSAALDGSGGFEKDLHFTLGHLDDAIGWAEGATSEAGIASAACGRLSRTVLATHAPPEVHGDVDTMWDYLKTSFPFQQGQCCCWARGLAYVLRCLGISGRVAFCNLKPALNIGCDISGHAFCSACQDYVYKRGWSGHCWNTWQGAAYFESASPLKDTQCYSVQHNYQLPYWRIGNDKRSIADPNATPPCSGPGVAFEYYWVKDTEAGYQQVIQSQNVGETCTHESERLILDESKWN